MNTKTGPDTGVSFQSLNPIPNKVELWTEMEILGHKVIAAPEDWNENDDDTDPDYCAGCVFNHNAYQISAPEQTANPSGEALFRCKAANETASANYTTCLCGRSDSIWIFPEQVQAYKTWYLKAKITGAK